MEITSSQNEKIKFVKSLSQKKYRKQHGMFVLEGEKLLLEAIKSGYKVRMLFYVDAKSIKGIESAESYQIPNALMQKITQMPSGTGVVAVLEQKPPDASTQTGTFLVLENVQDAGNFGAIVRTAHACDILDIYTIDCVDAFEIKTLRASMGALFHVRLHTCTLQEFMAQNTSPLICASMEGDNIYEQNVTLPKRCGIVLGNEGHGVSEVLRAQCLQTISIPMKKEQESLNVAVSASLIMYAIKYNLKQTK